MPVMAEVPPAKAGLNFCAGYCKSGPRTTTKTKLTTHVVAILLTKEALY
jgi:hypothetical protein